MINQKKRLEHQGFWDFFWKSPTSKEDWKKTNNNIYIYILNSEIINKPTL